jgi:hypothetical protein
LFASARTAFGAQQAFSRGGARVSNVPIPDLPVLAPKLESSTPFGHSAGACENVRVDIMAERGLYEDAKKGKVRCSDPHLGLKDMEADGVDAEVIYGVLGTASKLNDSEASNEVLRIYNDWLKDFCSHYPGTARSASPACPMAASISR